MDLHSQDTSHENLESSIVGPYEKPDSHYLTNEGWPLGTTCHYFVVRENGMRLFVCGKDVESIKARAYQVRGLLADGKFEQAMKLAHSERTEGW
jgi:hypothetical protein